MHKTHLWGPRIPDLFSPLVNRTIEQVDEEVERDIHGTDADECTVTSLVCWGR